MIKTWRDFLNKCNGNRCKSLNASWRDVKKELPKEFCDVLVIINKDYNGKTVHFHKNAIYVAYFEPLYDGKYPRFYINDDVSDIISYWKELSTPPTCV